MKREGREGDEPVRVLLADLPEPVVRQPGEPDPPLGGFPLDAGGRQREDLHVDDATVLGLQPVLDDDVGAHHDIVVPLIGAEAGTSTPKKRGFGYQ